ncbi:MAG: hypothetical protein AB1633_04475 [Elusimicrobiota bacterium]
MKIKTIFLFLIYILFFALSSESAEVDVPPRSLIDIPTAEVIDLYAMEMDFRLYSEGGIISKLNFGVFRRLNFGISWDVARVVGTKSPEPRPPAMTLKFRIFDGSNKLPAIALGYDGQGYNYDSSSGTYLHKEKGMFIVADTEALIDNLWLHFGGNLSFYKENNRDKTYSAAFIGVDYSIVEQEKKLISLLVEYDNLFQGIKEARFNCALRFFPAPALTIDFAFRNIIPQTGFEVERLLKIDYQTKF